MKRLHQNFVLRFKRFVAVLCDDKKGVPTPGVEPGPAGWEPAILTARPCRIEYVLYHLKSIFEATNNESLDDIGMVPKISTTN